MALQSAEELRNINTQMSSALLNRIVQRASSYTGVAHTAVADIFANANLNYNQTLKVIHQMQASRNLNEYQTMLQQAEQLSRRFGTTIAVAVTQPPESYALFVRPRQGGFEYLVFDSHPRSVVRGVPQVHGENILPGSYFLRFNNSGSLITYIQNLGGTIDGIGDRLLYTIFDATFVCDIQAQG